MRLITFSKDLFVTSTCGAYLPPRCSQHASSLACVIEETPAAIDADRWCCDASRPAYLQQCYRISGSSQAIAPRSLPIELSMSFLPSFHVNLPFGQHTEGLGSSPLGAACVGSAFTDARPQLWCQCLTISSPLPTSLAASITCVRLQPWRHEKSFPHKKSLSTEKANSKPTRAACAVNVADRHTLTRPTKSARVGFASCKLWPAERLLPYNRDPQPQCPFRNSKTSILNTGPRYQMRAA